MQEQLAQALGERCASRLAGHNHVMPRLRLQLFDLVETAALARAFDTFQSNEFTFH